MTGRSFDPRAWNLFAGVVLATGCGSRTIGADDDEGTSAESTPTQATVSTSGGECVSDSDCPSYYYCYDGYCEYVPHVDGSWFYDCYDDSDCGPLALCEGYYCAYVPEPPACDLPGPEMAMLDIPAVGVELAFVSLDGGPQRALALLTATTVELHVDGADAPISSPLAFDGALALDMAAGPFDAEPGDELAVVVGATIERLSGDGFGAFAPLDSFPAAIDAPAQLIPVELDGAPPLDLAVFGAGLGVHIDGVPALWFAGGEFEAATARSLPDPTAGLTMLSGADPILQWFDWTSELLSSRGLRGLPPATLTQYAPGGVAAVDIATSIIANDWTYVETFDLDPLASWSHAGQVSAVLSGDFDGTGFGDLALVIDGELRIHLNILSPSSCVTGAYPVVPDLRSWDAGDFDGDGDDDLALLLADDRLVVFDGGG